MSFMTKKQGECTETDQNPDNCPHYALLVSLFDWPSSLIDPALYRGPERLAWKMISDRPQKLRDIKDGAEYSLDILACETSPYIENGNREYDWHGVRYELDIGVSLLPDKKTGYAHWNYAVKLVRSPNNGTRLTCAGTPEKP
jgi:hypothetical protein